MKISKLIEELQFLEIQHGDLEVEVRNPAGDFDSLHHLEIDFVNPPKSASLYRLSLHTDDA